MICGHSNGNAAAFRHRETSLRFTLNENLEILGAQFRIHVVLRVGKEFEC